MARGRMILKKIGQNREVNDLGSDSSRLAYTWTICHLDREGRIRGDPCILRNTVFPRREDFTTEMMRQCIAEWARHGLVILYEVNQDWYLSFPTFRECQIGLRWEREPESELPKPPKEQDPECIQKYTKSSDITLTSPISGNLPEGIRQSSGNLPSEFNVREEKRIKNSPRKPILEAEKPATIRKTSGKEAGVPAAAQEPPTDLTLFHAVEASFLSKNDGKFTDYGREKKAIKDIIKRAEKRAPEDPAVFVQSMLDAFWKLKQNGNAFWKGQPFTPSTLNGTSIWDRVLETMREDKLDPDVEAIIKGKDEDIF